MSPGTPVERQPATHVDVRSLTETVAFGDALAGVDGTADPVVPAMPPVLFADPTAERMAAGSTDLPAVLVRPLDQVQIDPEMLARAEAELARLAARDRAELQHAVSARRDAVARAAARQQAAPAVPQRLSAVTAQQLQKLPSWLPPSIQDAVRKGIAQNQTATQARTTSKARTTSQIRPAAQPRLKPGAPAVSQAPPPRSAGSAQKRKSGSGAMGVLVFIIVVLFATGLGQKILDAILSLINR